MKKTRNQPLFFNSLLIKLYLSDVILTECSATLSREEGRRDVNNDPLGSPVLKEPTGRQHKNRFLY
jgi:hypothetical protein